MTLQGSAASLLALGVDAHPALRPGVHLRWTVRPSRGFPPLGFDIFRRAHRPGTPRLIDFSAEAPRRLAATETIVGTVWTAAENAPRLGLAQLAAGSVTVLEPGYGTLTCRFPAVDGPLRRVGLDLVHSAATAPGDPPVSLSVWGVAGAYRVAHGDASFTFQNLRQVVTVAIAADALDGFQLRGGDFGILRVRWTLVYDEADQGWGAPLNPQRIGFPVTAAGYQVPHAHGPDASQGLEDWQEASDRLRAGQPQQPPVGLPPLAPALAQRFGPPAFDDIRALMREAVRRATFISLPAPTQPQLSMSAVEATLLTAVDPDMARLLGLAMVDGTAALGDRYDYRMVAYWPGEPRWVWDCSEPPDGGTPGTPEVPGTPGGPIVITVPAGGGVVVRARPLAGLPVPPDIDLGTLPGLATLEPIVPTPIAAPGTLLFGTPALPSVPPPPPAERSSVVVQLPEPTPRAQVTVRAASGSPLVVTAVAGATIVSITVTTVPAGGSTEITVVGPGITTIVITGLVPVVTTTCRLTLTIVPVTEEWIAFDVTRGPVPPLVAPGPLAGTVLPGFAREGAGASGEQVVGLVLEPPRPAAGPFDLLPLAMLPLDAVAYDLERRADGAGPLGEPEAGEWVRIPTDPATGRPRPVMRTQQRPPVHRAPTGWPVEPQDFIDGTVDPDVRYYSYRARGRDVFGRVSEWAMPVTVDAADRVGPPAPDVVAARWLDRGHPWLDADDAALLDARGVAAGVRLRWRWPPQRQAQAPDARAFRVYWSGRTFTTIAGTVLGVQGVGDVYVLSIVLPLFSAPPPNAFAGDWLRQGSRQYLVRSSAGLNLLTIIVSAAGMPAPGRGACTLSLRAPDAQRLDLLGNPLRRNPTPATWELRVAEGAIVRQPGAAAAVGAGAAVAVQQVRDSAPRAGVATVTLAGGWRWSGSDAAGLALDAGGTPYAVLGGSLGVAAELVVDAAAGAPPAGPATLRDARGLLTTVRIPALSANAAAPFDLVGGTLSADGATIPVLAHRAVVGGVELVLAGPVAPDAPSVWHPDYEVLLEGLALPISADQPQATGVVGVSAVDGRAYAPDARQVPGEPTSPGNEGPAATAIVERRYRGAPAASPSLGAGTAALWAPAPDPFSGTSRYPLRWAPAAGAVAYVVLHASLDAVLDADAADRAAARGVYAGMPALAGAALAQWRAQQAVLGAAALQALATAQPAAFVSITPAPLAAADPLLADPATPGGLRWVVPLDGSAPGRHFLRLQSVDAAGNRGPVGDATRPIIVPDVRRPAPPRLRRVLSTDRALWVVWDAPELAVTTYRVYRTQLPAGSRPDVRDMTRVATVASAESPEPVAVFGGAARLGRTPASVVAVYRAEEYDPTQPPDAQGAAPLPGPVLLAGSLVSGLGALPDGALVFVVVRDVPGGPAVLSASATARAWRDATAAAGVRCQYRVVAERDAAVSPNATRTVRSFASDVAEGESFEAGPPLPPAAVAAWQPAQARVLVTWAPAGLTPGLEVTLQRTQETADLWRSVTPWMPASAGSAEDTTAASGRSYLYRLRVRSAARRVSAGELAIGPVVIP